MVELESWSNDEAGKDRFLSANLSSRYLRRYMSQNKNNHFGTIGALVDWYTHKVDWYTYTVELYTYVHSRMVYLLTWLYTYLVKGISTYQVDRFIYLVNWHTYLAD